jgi:hypothetical protein
VIGTWRQQQLTHGAPEGPFHAHSYYDIHVFDDESKRIAAHRMDFAGRWMTPEDRVAVGYVDAEGGGFTPVGESTAWSWQQGPMAQWIPGTRKLVWNDRAGNDFIARVHDCAAGSTTTLPRAVYAIAPDGRAALALDMARLDKVRPGYGYVGGRAGVLQRRPRKNGVWRLDPATGEARLILSLHRAVGFLMQRMGWRAWARHLVRRYVYWFNHAKISPDGRRFTVKLRFRARDLKQGWNERMGVSLTCGMDGEDLRLLAHGTSHVIWEDPETLYYWRRGGLQRVADRAPEGAPLGPLAPDLIRDNVHIRHFPGAPGRYVFDTPYAEEIDLMTWAAGEEGAKRIARFTGHVPARGPFRCDLHPVPSPDGRRLVVTSLQGGGRQIHLLERKA